MRRFAILVEYDGRPFVGWQRQDNGPSIQEALEDAVAAFSGERVHVQGAGRTDAGVHARGQVAHFDLAKEMAPRQVQAALNHHLKPHPVAVLEARLVPQEFHARFSAIRRVYRYRIVNRRAPLTFDRGRAWWIPVPLDVEAMNEAAQRLVGRHDFTTFRHVACQTKSPVKTLDLLAVERIVDEVHIHAVARSFLHHQVRSMTGTLSLVGLGKWSADDVTAALEARDRKAVGHNAPPDGLCLMRVDY